LAKLQIGIFGSGVVAGLVQTNVFKPELVPAPEPDYPLMEEDQK